MIDRNDLAPGEDEVFDPGEREADVEDYNAAPDDMPPSPAGADVEIGGEAASSRRQAGLPQRLSDTHGRGAEGAASDAEPVLGYDGLDVDDAIGWIRDADPAPGRLRAIIDYESTHLDREAVLRELRERLDRFEEPGTT